MDKSTRYQEQTKKIIFDISFSLEALEKLPSSLTSVERYVKAVINEASLNCKDKKFSSFMCFLALSSVIGCEIRSIYQGQVFGTKKYLEVP